MSKPHTKKVVDKKFLNTLADEIYNPKHKTYIRLCTGTLQNGPDPVDGKRTMHCGLGELYFKLTHRQPDTDKIEEDDVIEECLRRSALNPEGKYEKERDTLEKTLNKELKKLNLPDAQIQDMITAAVDCLDEDDIKSKAQNFRAILERIPTVNDETGQRCEGGDVCSAADFQARSKAVANLLREAAELLPE